MDMSTLLSDLGHDKQSNSSSASDNNDKTLKPGIDGVLSDIFVLCSDTNSSLYSVKHIMKTMQDQIGELQQELKDLKTSVDRTEAYVETNWLTDSDNMDGAHTRNAQHTKKVSSWVVAAIIRSIWHTNKGKDLPVPVSMEYLSKLCDKCFAIDKSLKSDLGVLLSTQIDSIDVDTGAGTNMLAVLSTVQNSIGATMLRSVLKCITLLGTTYAFMVDIELSSLLNRVSVFSEGVAVLNNKVNESSMVCARGGYNIKPEDKLSVPRVMKAFELTVSVGNTVTSAKNLCKCIEQNLIDKDGKFIATASNKKVSMFTPSARNNSVTQATTPRTQGVHISLDKVTSPRKINHN